MEQLDRLKRIINGRTVGLCAGGASIEGLEHTSLPDICWCGLGVFNILEDGLFKPRNKRFDIVFDCSSIPESNLIAYERYWRIPRLQEYLERDDFNIFITTHGLLRDSFKALEREDLIEKHEYKIMQVDKIFPDHSWMDVPNSVTLCVAALLAGGAYQVILFGVDGYNKDPEKGVLSYYDAEEFEKDRVAALGTNIDVGINRDTSNFEQRFPELLGKYYRLFQTFAPVYNCSPITVYNCIPKITYEEMQEIAKRRKQ